MAEWWRLRERREGRQGREGRRQDLGAGQVRERVWREGQEGRCCRRWLWRGLGIQEEGVRSRLLREARGASRGEHCLTCREVRDWTQQFTATSTS